MVIDRLHLHLIARSIAAVIAFGRVHWDFAAPALDPSFDVGESAEVITRRGEFVLAEEGPHRLDFFMGDGRPAMDPGFQDIEQALCLPPIVFCGHVSSGRFSPGLAPSLAGNRPSPGCSDAHLSFARRLTQPKRPGQADNCASEGTPNGAFLKPPATPAHAADWRLLRTRNVHDSTGGRTPTTLACTNVFDGPKGLCLVIRRVQFARWRRSIMLPRAKCISIPVAAPSGP